MIFVVESSDSMIIRFCRRTGFISRYSEKITETPATGATNQFTSS